MGDASWVASCRIFVQGVGISYHKYPVSNIYRLSTRHSLTSRIRRILLKRKNWRYFYSTLKTGVPDRVFSPRKPSVLSPIFEDFASGHAGKPALPISRPPKTPAKHCRERCPEKNIPN